MYNINQFDLPKKCFVCLFTGTILDFLVDIQQLLKK